jgi:hypothetical protein
MGVRIKKLYPALKHGGYSATGLLPGEDPAAFEKLHRDLISEHCPDGPLQEDTVFDIARLMWRKKNLETFRVAEAARERASAIRSKMIPSTTPPFDFPFWGYRVIGLLLILRTLKQRRKLQRPKPEKNSERTTSLLKWESWQLLLKCLQTWRLKNV